MRREQEPVSRITVIVPHYSDLTVSKLAAGRTKDMVFVRRVLKMFDLPVEQVEALLNEYVREVPDRATAALKHLNIFKDRG